MRRSNLFGTLSDRIELLFGFCMFLCVVYYYPPSELRSDQGIGLVKYLLLFITPAIITSTAIIASVFPKLSSYNLRLNTIKGLLLGTEAGLGFLGIEVLYFWYDTPDNSKLEPLFVSVTLAVGGAEAARRFIESLFMDNEG